MDFRYEYKGYKKIVLIFKYCRLDIFNNKFNDDFIVLSSRPSNFKWLKFNDKIVVHDLKNEKYLIATCNKESIKKYYPEFKKYF